MSTEARDPQGWVVNTSPFRHCSAGLYIGPMRPEPKTGEFASVLTLAAEPGTVDDAIRHRHLPLSYQVMDRVQLEQAINWTLAQFEADRTILIRSEGGKQRPALVAAATFLRLGATYFEALQCITTATPGALTDFRYRNILKEMDGRS